MPKKKLTKARVKALIKDISNKAALLALDKSMHPDSRVPISVKALLDVNSKFANAWKRVK